MFVGAHLGSASIKVREEAHSDLQKGPLCRFRRACRRYGTGRNRHPKVRTEASCNRVGDPGESCTWAPKASKRAYVYHWVSTSILTSKSPGWPLWSGPCPPPWDYCGQACVPPPWDYWGNHTKSPLGGHCGQACVPPLGTRHHMEAVEFYNYRETVERGRDVGFYKYKEKL